MRSESTFGALLRPLFGLFPYATRDIRTVYFLFQANDGPLES
jgi:hypothetical protein